MDNQWTPKKPLASPQQQATLPPQGSPTPSHAVPFDKIVSDIKSSQNSQKRGPGRPRKDAVSSAQAPNSSQGFTPQQGLNSSAPIVTPTAPSNVAPELIAMTVRALSNIPATRFKNPGYLVDEEQALEDGKTLKPSVDALLDKWLPHVGPYALEFSFAVAVLSIAFRQVKSAEAYSESQYAKPDKPKVHDSAPQTGLSA